MTEKLTIYSSDFIETNQWYGHDMLHAKPLHAVAVDLKVGETDGFLQRLAAMQKKNETVQLHFYDSNGYEHEVPIVSAHKLDTHDDPYPHESIAVYVLLTEEMQKLLYPPPSQHEFGY